MLTIPVLIHSLIALATPTAAFGGRETLRRVG
jgi:hypothetical protein